MTLGPIEILVLSFPENRFTGAILPELAKLVETNTITIVDGLFVTKDENGVSSYFEFDEIGSKSEVASLASLMSRANGLISDDDVSELSAGLDPDSSAAILAFEHTWVAPLRNAIVDAGGVLVDSIRVPADVVEEVMSALSDDDEAAHEEAAQ